MVNVILNKTSGTSGQTVVKVTPEAYIGKNDATKKVTFTNAKGTTAELTCLFKGTGEYIYDNPVITEVVAPNFLAMADTEKLKFKGYQIYRETSDGDEVGRLEFTQDTVADGFSKYMENTAALPSDVTLDKEKCEATVGSKGTVVSEETIKFSINLSVTYNGKTTTKNDIPWKQDANNVVSTEFENWVGGYTGTEYNIEVEPGSTYYDINKEAHTINTYSSGDQKGGYYKGTLTKDTNVDGWDLNADYGRVTYPANTTTDTVTGIDVILSYGSESIKLKFTQLGIEPAISITPTLLTFESGSTTPQNVIVDSTDSWTAK